MLRGYVNELPASNIASSPLFEKWFIKQSTEIDDSLLGRDSAPRDHYDALGKDIRISRSVT